MGGFQTFFPFFHSFILCAWTSSFHLAIFLHLISSSHFHLHSQFQIHFYFTVFPECFEYTLCRRILTEFPTYFPFQMICIASCQIIIDIQNNRSQHIRIQYNTIRYDNAVLMSAKQRKRRQDHTIQNRTRRNKKQHMTWHDKY